jgi:predicted RNA binding protein YcfA (HicA-like mRNA interferase family)
MKRRDLLRHLKHHGCRLEREGGRHSCWCNADGTRRTVVPRHTEIKRFTGDAICRDLGIPPFDKR